MKSTFLMALLLMVSCVLGASNALSSPSSCDTLLLPYDLSTNSFRALDTESKISILHRPVLSLQDYYHQQIIGLDGLSGPGQKVFASIKKYLLEHVPQRPKIDLYYKDLKIVSCGLPKIEATVLTDPSSDEVLGLAAKVYITGVMMPSGYCGPDHFYSVSSAIKKGANSDIQASWSFGGATIEVLGNEYKVLQEDYTQTWTGF